MIRRWTYPNLLMIIIITECAVGILAKALKNNRVKFKSDLFQEQVRGSKSYKKYTYRSRKNIFRKLCCGFFLAYGRSRGACFLTWYQVRRTWKGPFRDLKSSLQWGDTEDWSLNPLRNPTRRKLKLGNCSRRQSCPRGVCVGVCLHSHICQGKATWMFPVHQRQASWKRGAVWSCFDSCPDTLPRRTMKLR